MHLEVKTNHRAEPNDFTMEYSCDFCSNYVDKVLVLPIPKDDPVYICKTCLTRCIEYIDRHYVNNFKADFINSRFTATKGDQRIEI